MLTFSFHLIFGRSLVLRFYSFFCDQNKNISFKFFFLSKKSIDVDIPFKQKNKCDAPSLPIPIIPLNLQTNLIAVNCECDQDRLDSQLNSTQVSKKITKIKERQHKNSCGCVAAVLKRVGVGD